MDLVQAQGIVCNSNIPFRDSGSVYVTGFEHCPLILFKNKKEIKNRRKINLKNFIVNNLSSTVSRI